MSLMPTAHNSEVETLWRGVLTTLKQRGLLLARPQQGGYLVPEGVTPVVLPERIVFVLDMQRLGNIPRERWIEPALAAQIRATLGGHPVVVTDSAGLAIQIAREPFIPVRDNAQRQSLPRHIPLLNEHLTSTPYQVCLGYAETGPIYLDLAIAQRALLVGGTSGSGKTNFLQSVVTQLAAKHGPEEVQLAILDPKMVDFVAFSGLPQLFQPIAHEIADCERLIEQVAGELHHRQALLNRAGVNLWERYNANAATPLPLLLLLVDEAADFAGTPTMNTLVNVARKGRAFGISVIVATQHPTSNVIDSQAKANLPTCIAFHTRTGSDSRVILDANGAEHLRHKGRCLAALDLGLVEVQALYINTERLSELLGSLASGTPGSGLDDREAALVRLAQMELDGAFNVSALYEHPWNRFSESPRRYRISKRQLTTLAQTWEKRGWLTAQSDAASPRQITKALLELLPQAEEG